MASKEWKAARSEFKVTTAFKKRLYNAEKYKELYDHFDCVLEKYEDNELLKTASRKIIEEVTNIVQWNDTWENLRVRTDTNTSKTRLKIVIRYEGVEYYNPQKIGNVMGSTELFKNYSREHKIDYENKEVRISINIEIK